MLSKVFAVGHKTELPETGKSLLSDSLTLDGLLSGGIGIFLTVITVAAFVSLIYSGFIYITAGDNTDQTTKARKNILWALVAIVIALSSYIIIREVADILGFVDGINQ